MQTRLQTCSHESSSLIFTRLPSRSRLTHLLLPSLPPSTPSLPPDLPPSLRFLYDILTQASMEEGPPVLIACHKSDVPGAKGPSRVKTLLTQEL